MTFSYTVTTEDIGSDIKKLLRSKFDFSSRLRAKIKREQLVRLNGALIDGWIKPEVGDVLTIDLPEESSGFTPQDIPLDILYEDDSLLILNKRPGFIVHPTKGHPANTLANGVMKYILDTGRPFKIRFINRLDMDTSGIVAVAKNAHSQADFMKQSQAGQVEKEYVAITSGQIEADQGVIDLPIGKLQEDQVKRGVVPDGRPSITHYTVTERFKSDYTHVRLSLQTGRTHQIRVHLAHIGHPIVGDHLYGTSNAFLIERQALHAARLSFPHPVTGKRLTIDAPLPEDMRTLLAMLRK